MLRFFSMQLIDWPWFITWLIRYWVDSTKYLTDQKFDLDFLPCNLNINREHSLSRGIHFTEFDDLQAKGSKDIEQAAFDQ